MLDHAENIRPAEIGLPFALKKAAAGAEAMAYEIRFLDRVGALIASHHVHCAGDKQAAILAHALRPAAARGLEVWRDEALVYERPHRRYSAPLEARRPPRLWAAE